MNINSKLFYGGLTYYPNLTANSVTEFMAEKDYDAIVSAEKESYSTVIEDDVTIIERNNEVRTRLGGNPNIDEQINLMAEEKVFNDLLSEFLDWLFESLAV